MNSVNRDVNIIHNSLKQSQILKMSMRRNMSTNSKIDMIQPTPQKLVHNITPFTNVKMSFVNNINNRYGGFANRQKTGLSSTQSNYKVAVNTSSFLRKNPNTSSTINVDDFTIQPYSRKGRVHNNSVRQQPDTVDLRYKKHNTTPLK